jgi:zinc/manganese transport system substrate-binding protein
MLKQFLVGLFGWLFFSAAQAEPIRIVAAENFYGQIAAQLGGPYVAVTSILQNPQQDPHLFSSNPEIAKAIAKADFVIYNGLGYDSWMVNLIEAANSKTKHIIIVGDLTDKTLGANPHIWYDPHTMLVYANYLTAQLSQLDSVHQAFYHQQMESFKADYEKLMAKIQTLKTQFHGVPVIATEPVFNEMAAALGLMMQGQNFQLSIMNGTEPSANATKAFEDALRNHQVKVLIYNNQVSNPVTDRMRKIAEKAHIPVVGISEIQPPEQNYWTWMNQSLDALASALTREISSDLF